MSDDPNLLSIDVASGKSTNHSQDMKLELVGLLVDPEATVALYEIRRFTDEVVVTIHLTESSCSRT